MQGLQKDVEDFMRDIRIQIVGAKGIVTKPITFERIQELQHRLDVAIYLAELARKRKL